MKTVGLESDLASEKLNEVFAALLGHFGPLSWWPAETPFEVCVGAILTQNTAWRNVEKAIGALKAAGILKPGELREVELEYLATLIKPAGYYNVKSQRLKDFVEWLFLHHDGSMEKMFSGEWHHLRDELLKVRGIGPETCDSILLYAGHKPTFVIDAYAKRLFFRLGLCAEQPPYEEMRSLFMECLPDDVPLFNEYHALIVEQCKEYCRMKPRCPHCPLQKCCKTCMRILD